MKILKAIWAFLNSKLLGYVIALLLIIFVAKMCQNISGLKKDNAKKEQNISALTDTIKHEKLKNGAQQVSINSFIANKKELEKLNKDLANEVNVQKGEVISLGKAVIKLQQTEKELKKYIDSLKLIIEKPVRLNDSTYVIPWTLPYTYDSTNYDIFKGKTTIGLKNNNLSLSNFKLSDIFVINEGTQLLSRTTQIDLVWGQKWENGKLRVFVNSKYPGFNATNLQGVLLDVPKKRHWFTGWSVNFGITPSYDFATKRPTFLIGPSIGYTIYHW